MLKKLTNYQNTNRIHDIAQKTKDCAIGNSQQKKITSCSEKESVSSACDTCYNAHRSTNIKESQC